ncbi:MAG: hypothetical protein ACOCYU_08335 [Brevefilum sp.]
MKKKTQNWLLFITGLVLCLTSALIGIIDALIPKTGQITLNITLLAAMFVMGLILAGRGLVQLIRNRKDR